MTAKSFDALIKTATLINIFFDINRSAAFDMYKIYSQLFFDDIVLYLLIEISKGYFNTYIGSLDRIK